MDWPGEKLCIHLIDVLERNFVSPFTDPWKTRRNGAAAIAVQTDQMKAIAQAEDEIARLRAGAICLPFDSAKLAEGSPALTPVATDEISMATAHSHAADAFTGNAVRLLRKEVNVGKAVTKAGEILLSDAGSVPDREPDADWLERWRDNAGAVSSEKMQGLWAQVLAREVRAPGSLSLRTLDVLRNLDSQDAEKIERVAPFVLHLGFVAKSFDGEGWVDFHLAVELQELGILTGVEAFGITLQISSESDSSFKSALAAGTWGLKVSAEDPRKTMNLKGYKVTAVGLEILQMVDADTVGVFEYLKDIGTRSLKEQGFDVQIGRIRYVSDDNDFVFEETSPL